MDYIYLNNIKKINKQIFYEYQISRGLEKYFHKKNLMWIEYDFDITDVPDSVAAIPFVCNILPIIWICDACLHVAAMDLEFYERICKIREGYEQMYPKICFKGKIIVDKIINNSSKKSDKSACFFSGGVDAFSTLFTHIEESPLLITVWGADISLDDTYGWDEVKQHLKTVSNDFVLESCCIKSNFRTFIKSDNLDELIFSRSNESWWHGFQHGIGLLGQAAPIAYKFNITSIYIGSTFTEKDRGKVTCASDPSIDNHVHYCNASVYHDGYEYSRQDKINHIIQVQQRLYKPVSLRVCWESSGGKNCCHCEKCYRTIMGIVAEGADPNNYGFFVDRRKLEDIRKFIQNKYLIGPILMPLWKDIQFAANNNKGILYEKESTEWICNVKFQKMTFIKLLKKLKIILINKVKK